uniref:(northern house mosquito) hypothetical protein n=1 Tax=Culex pipiens TaxID=7175 RepID=A0A8D8IY32_CULPI
MCRMVSDVRNSPGNEAGIGDGDDDDDGRGRCWRCCCCCYCSNCVEDLRRLQDQHECVGQFLGRPVGAPLSSWSWPRPLHSSLLQSPTVSLALSLGLGVSSRG